MGSKQHLALWRGSTAGHRYRRLSWSRLDSIPDHGVWRGPRSGAISTSHPAESRLDGGRWRCAARRPDAFVPKLAEGVDHSGSQTTGLCHAYQGKRSASRGFTISYFHSRFRMYQSFASSGNPHGAQGSSHLSLQWVQLRALPDFDRHAGVSFPKEDRLRFFFSNVYLTGRLLKKANLPHNR